VQIDSPPEVVYRAVTTSQGLARWWTEDLEIASHVGGVSTFRFSSGAFNRMRLVGLSPDERVEWECVDGASEWIRTSVSFELREYEGGTRLLFEHGDWREASVYMAECSFQWARYLESLKQYCQVGVGDPDQRASLDEGA
jgi:uncharacterized protein YndB with AHSA1/START domain